jgi:hypothetical protein
VRTFLVQQILRFAQDDKVACSGRSWVNMKLRILVIFAWTRIEVLCVTF